jgi:aldehyde:ferredoxin oxidoreductase
VYLTVIDGKVAFRDAGHLMGKLTGEVEAILKEEFDDPKIHILQHGPGAENGVLFSALMSMANRANGRTGMGLVMASKNLKAIVVKGTKKMEMADRDGLKALMKTGPGLMKENEDVDGCGTFGTAICMNIHNEVGAQPFLNYNEGQWDRAVDISGETMSDTILLKRDTCYACIVRCKRVVEITEPPTRWTLFTEVPSSKP